MDVLNYTEKKYTPTFFSENVVCRELIREAIQEHHYKEMKEDLDGSKKMEDIKDEDFRSIQPYMNNKSIQVGRIHGF